MGIMREGVWSVLIAVAFLLTAMMPVQEAALATESAQGPAATMTVTPDRPVSPGEIVTVSYSDPSKANQTVTVVVDNGDILNKQTAEITIHLNESGNGTGTWTVIPWGLSAKFNAPGVPEKALVID